MPDMDAIDRNILAILQRAARTPLSSLAKMVGRSRTAVQSRITRLEKTGIIRGYHAVLNSGGDTQGLSALMILYLHERTQAAPVIKVLEGVPEVVGCYRVTGEADLMVALSYHDPKRLHEIGETIWSLPEVKESNTLVVLKTFIESLFQNPE
ncbi:Lrp/AsnC family transcriptional regulator [Pacificimonas sp. ICDLI1SI03]|jgi:DNA-binding Lrp family transcriptional regulator|tara:strand:+ start:137642 stop:138097 length:456 start_codon:yes stop_codon:yes gene_type:complete